MAPLISLLPAGPAQAAVSPLGVEAGFFGINAERPHEDVYNSDTLTTGDDSWDSYTIEATVNVHETSTANGTAGLIIRSDGAGEDFYYFGIYPNENRWKLYTPGFPDPLEGSYNIGLDPKSYRLKAAVTPESITVFIDDHQVGHTEDLTRDSGEAGLRIRNSDSDFSQVKIDGVAQSLTGWTAAHPVSWAGVAGSSVRGNVLLDPVLLSSAEYSPELDAEFSMMAAAGATQVRFMLSWAEIQPQGSGQAYSWRYADAFAIAAHRYNLDVIPITIFAPRWAVAPQFRYSGYYQAYPPVDGSGNFDTSGFSQFVASATGRYKAGGDLATLMGWSSAEHGQAKYFEVGPEFNLGTIYEQHDGVWVPVSAGWMGSLSQFVDLLRAGHDAVKSQCPACLVLNGAPADDTITNYYIGDDPSRYDGYEPVLDSRLNNPDGTPAWRQTVWQGVDDLYSEIERRPAPDNVPGRYFDVLNIHTFMWKGYASERPVTVDRYVNCSYYSDDCWRQWYQTRLDQVTRIMQEHNDAARDVWVSETGFPSAHPSNDYGDFLGFLSEAKQAQALKTAYSAASDFPSVKRVFWWQGYDSDYTGNLGLVRNDLSAKRSYAAYGWLTGMNPTVTSDYSFSWYDNVYAANWILMANPATSPGDAWFSLSVAGQGRGVPALAGMAPGQVPPGGILYARYPGLMGGPVNASYSGGEDALVSQRTLWAGNSLEEIPGTDAARLSDHFFWPWYDEQGCGCRNWIVVSNPSSTPVYFIVRFSGTDFASGLVDPGASAVYRFPGLMGGPVEVQAWSDGFYGLMPAEVMASQRVLSNQDTAFNEVPGIPASDLSSHYYWTWYDMKSAGARNWIMIANPPGAAPIWYEIRIGGDLVKTGGPIPAGYNDTPTFPGSMGGPVEVSTFADASRQFPANSIASQRSQFGPSFEEIPGMPSQDLTGTYHWTWYDMQSAGARNWVLVANPPGAGPIWYEIRIGGNLVRSGGPIQAGNNEIPTFPGNMGGPVEVRTFADAGHNIPAASVTSQRVLWNGFFNEVMGSVLD